MARIHIALQEGFSGDTVILRLNEQDVYNKRGVKTRMQVGRADSIDIDSPDSEVDVEINLPDRGISQTVHVSATAPTFVGFSLGRNGQLEHHISQEPFRYA